MQIEGRPISNHYANIIAISHAKHSINVNHYKSISNFDCKLVFKKV